MPQVVVFGTSGSRSKSRNLGKLFYPKGNPEALNRKETKNGLQMTAKYSAKQIGELLGGEDWFEKQPTSSCGR